MRGKISDKVRLQHMYDSIIEIESYIKNKKFSDFIEDSMMRFACIKQMEIIGEASNHISKETKLQNPEVEWKQITGLRNIFVHEYFGIDLMLVWEIIENDIPYLKRKIIEILSKE